MRFPETDPFTYRSWAEEEWYDVILEELEKLLLYVRVHGISGLLVGKIRGAVFVPFGGPDLFNRKVSLYTKEIKAYNDAWKSPVDEEELSLGWKLSGLRRP